MSGRGRWGWGRMGGCRDVSIIHHQSQQSLHRHSSGALQRALPSPTPRPYTAFASFRHDESPLKTPFSKDCSQSVLATLTKATRSRVTPSRISPYQSSFPPVLPLQVPSVSACPPVFAAPPPISTLPPTPLVHNRKNHHRNHVRHCIVLDSQNPLPCPRGCFGYQLGFLIPVSNPSSPQ